MKARLPRMYLWNQPQEAALLRLFAAIIDVASITTGQLEDLIARMIRVMKKADGIGLAAPQIGQSIRLAVLDRRVTPNRQPLVLYNPVVTHSSQEQTSEEEGCLSIPGVFGLVPRARSIVVNNLDASGRLATIEADGLFARVIQHEIDHLNGKLFIDRATMITQGKDRL
ncbi:MAG: peptide deformylase [Candidatus Kerfeldbacteria bacterium]|nr:peptide deformylase [Candidatus Kerfeldbacteria bacterium]